MATPNTNQSGYICAECGSQSTQDIAIAYAKSVRTSDSGYDSVSAYGAFLAPPEARDDKVIPSIVACVTAAGCLFLLPGLFDRLEILIPVGPVLLGWAAVLGSCVIGWTVGLIVAIPAIRYNVRVLPQLRAAWADQIVCNRCFHTWPASGNGQRVASEAGHEI